MVVIGNTIGIYVNNQLIGCLTSNSFESENEEIEVTCKDFNGARQVRGGTNSASMPFEGNFNPTSSFGFLDLLAIHKDRTRVGVKQYDTESRIYVIGYAFLNTLSWTAPLNDASTFTGEFTVDGEWDYGTNT